MGLYKVIGPKHDTAFAFLTNKSIETINETTTEPNKGADRVKVLVVQLLPKHSTIIFYKRSHLHTLRAQMARIGLLQVLPESLQGNEIEPCKVEMRDGGL